MSIWGSPRLPTNLLERPRITELLDGPEAIVLLRAPAGFGKTVALGQWARSARASGVWSRVREEGTGSGAFVQQLAEDLRDAGRLEPHNPLVAARDVIVGGGDPWRLLERGLRRLEPPLSLAVDQIDKLTDDAIAGMLQLLVDVPGLELRATARRLTALSETALGTVVDARVVGVHELALTTVEAAEVLDASAESALVAEVVAGGGAPILARSLALPVRNEGTRVAERSPAAAVDSLLRLQAQAEGWDREFVDFLLAISPADAVTLGLARELSGSTSAAEFLERAESGGIGMWALAGPEPLFIISPLVRERLEEGLKREHPADVAPLRARIASWARQHDQHFTALRFAVADQDWDAATEIVRMNWYELLHNHGTQLRRLFQKVPMVALRKRPLIAMMLGLAYNAQDATRLRAVEYFALSALAAKEQRTSGSAPDRALLRTVESVSMRVTGRIEAAEVAASDAFDVLLGMSAEDRDRLGLIESTLFNQVGTTFFYAGRTDDALESFRRSTAAGIARGARGGLQGLALLAGTHATSGDLPQAVAAMREVEAADWPDGWLDGYPGSFYHVAGAWVALERFDTDAAEAHVRSLDPHRATIEHWAVLAHLDAMILLMRHTPERALLQLTQVENEQRRRRAAAPSAAGRLRHTRALLELAAGDPASAARTLGPQAGDPIHDAIGMARVALARQDPERALRILQSVPPDRHRSARAHSAIVVLRTAALAQTTDGVLDAGVLERMVDYLDDRGQSLALALVPETSLAALERAASDSGNERIHGRVRSAHELRLITDRAPLPRLTPREAAVARQLSGSGSNAEIAAALSVSENTVKSQLRSLYRKLEVSTRADALRALAAQSLIEDRVPPTRRE
jgi:LuxR family maltose regulon positive regulatory protein